MPIEFNCSACQAILRTPDETAGKAARCPKCGNVEPIPDPNRESSHSKPGSIPAAEHPVARPVFPGDQPATNPYAVQSSDYAQTPAYDPSWNTNLYSERSVRARLQAPAIATLVFCCFSILLAGLAAVGGVIDVIDGGAMPEDVVGLVGCSGVVLLEAIAAIGCVSMLRMRNYVFCIVGMICAIIGGVFCCLLPSGFGVWGLVVLLQPDVKHFFQ